jgi:hypothetical protein
MNVSELCEKTEWRIVAGSGNKEITSVYVCDLLSWVMSHGQPGTVWITVQTHENVLAVASLHDFSCVLLPENIEPSSDFLNTANEKDITVLTAPCSSYGAAMILCRLGIGEVS